MRTMTYLLLFLCLGLGGSLAIAAPEVQFPSTEFDFGDVYQGTEVRHTFTFVNAGEDPLLIDRVRSSCGCTAVLVSDKTIDPGETGSIQANFDSTRFRGPVSKTIYLYSNDPQTPVMHLKIKGNVIEVVAINPPQINFGKVPGDQSLASRTVLRNQGKQVLSFGKPSTTAVELQADMPVTSLAPGEETVVELILTPKPGANRFSGYVLIPVDGVPKNQLRIPVYASFDQ